MENRAAGGCNVPGDDGIGRVLPFTLADQGEAAEAGKTGAAEENASSASADPETFCVGQCVTFTLFSNRLKRSLKRAGRVSLSGQPLFATAKGTVVDVQGAAGSIRPVAASAEAGTGGVATALKEVPFAATEALDPVRAGDEAFTSWRSRPKTARRPLGRSRRTLA